MNKLNNTKFINPDWLTGFTDAEGCFTVVITQRSNLNWRVIVEINLHTKDISILELIKDFFGVGYVTTRIDKSKSVYRVTKVEDLLHVIIPHFLSYPLLSQKRADFLLWNKVVNLIHTKQHLTTSGFSTILSYYASINRGMSPKVLATFPQIVGVSREEVLLPDKLNPNWVSGFAAGDGGFSIGIRKNTGQIYFRFHIAQHSRDISLLKLFINFFGCGTVRMRSNSDGCDFFVQDFSDIYRIINPHFIEYPLNNVKSLDFNDFHRAAELFKVSGRSESEAIKKIINNMNSKRK